MPKRTGPNEVWAGWVQVEADAAAAKGSKAADAYTKAARAIRAHPDTLTHPTQAKSLPGVGQKVVDILTRKLAAHCADAGEAMPLQVPRSSQAASQSTSKKRKTTGKKAPPLQRRPVSEEDSDDDDSDDMTEPEPEPQLGQNTKAKRKAPVQTPRVYVPQARSGGWAILIALYSLLRPYNLKTFYTKETIIPIAQPYCDKSFVPVASRFGGPSTSVTAWENVKMLKTKALIVEANSRPKKYALTKLGYDVALPLALSQGLAAQCISASELASEKDCDDEFASHAPPANRVVETAAASSRRSRLLQPAEPCPTDRVVETAAASSRRSRLLQTAEPSPTDHFEETAPASSRRSRLLQPSEPTTSSSFSYWFLTTKNERTKKREAAHGSFDPITSQPLWKVEFRLRDRYHRDCSSSMLPHHETLRRDDHDSVGVTLLGWMYGNRCGTRCTGFDNAPTTSTSGRNLQKSSTMVEPVTRTLNPSNPHLRPNLVRTGTEDGRSMQRTTLARTASNVFSIDLLSDSDVEETFTPSQTLPIQQPRHRIEDEVRRSLPTAAPTTQAVPNGQFIDGVPRSLPTASSSRIPSRAVPNGPFIDDMPRSLPTASPSQTSPMRLRIDDAPRPPQPRMSFPSALTVPVSQPQRDSSNATMTEFASSITPNLWRPGSFDVILILDNREKVGRDNEDGMLIRCQQAGIYVEQRPLSIGDAVWIGKHKQSRQEVLLGSILERKRMDDLCQSIVDSRFHEQKARMKRSGLTHLMYLIEEYREKRDRDHFNQSVRTCKVQLMLMDGFHLVQSQSWQDSADYLITHTQTLITLHNTPTQQPLSIIPSAHIDRPTFLPLLQELRLLHPNFNWVTTYDTFEALNGKSNTLTVTSMWAKMNACVSGMSAEKVGLVVGKWSTPRSFWEAYKDRKRLARDEDVQWERYLREGEELSPSQGTSSGKKGGRKKKRVKPNPEHWVNESLPRDYRAIGPALSKKMWELWDCDTY